jgi:aryl-alcohol dehydrogenase-like predicted oxidoreductase
VDGGRNPVTLLNTRTLGSTGLDVTDLGFGALEIGRDWAADVERAPEHLTAEDAARVLNELLDRGINFIDTAPAYWWSEEYIGKSISHRRSEYVLATKVGEHCDRDGSFYDYCAEATTAFIDRSLQKLKTDVIDLIQIHSASIEVLERGETWSALDAARQAGKVRFIGMTGNVDAAIRAIELGRYDTVQVPFNLLAPEGAHQLFPMCLEKGVGVIIMRGLAGGKLTPKYANLEDRELADRIAHLEERAKAMYPDSSNPLTRAALRYLLAEPAVSTAIIGTRRIEAIDKNLVEMADPVSPEEAAALRQLSEVAV